MPKYEINPESKEMIPIHSFEIEIEYVHNLKELYKRLQLWLEDKGWIDLFGDTNYEVRYWQRDLPGDRQEHHIWWRAWRHRSTAQTKSHFFKYYMTLNYQTINSQKTEVMHQGKKWKLWNTNTILRGKFFLYRDFEGLDGNEAKWFKNFKNRFTQWIYKDQLKEKEDELLHYAINFQNVIKDFLEIAKDKDIETGIHPPNELPR